MISVFDLDHTLLKQNSSFRFGAYLYRSRGISFFPILCAIGFYSLHKSGLLSLQSLHQRIFNTLFKGMSFAFIQDRAAQFVGEHVAHMVYEPALKRLQEAIFKGHRTVLLSSSPDFLIAPIADYLKVDEWAATPYFIDYRSCFSTVGPVLCGQGKKNYLDHLLQRDEIAREAVYAYSDSHLDLPLLEAAGHPVAVNPDRRLRSICQRRGWEII